MRNKFMYKRHLILALIGGLIATAFLYLFAFSLSQKITNPDHRRSLEIILDNPSDVILVTTKNDVGFYQLNRKESKYFLEQLRIFSLRGNQTGRVIVSSNLGFDIQTSAGTYEYRIDSDEGLLISLGEDGWELRPEDALRLKDLINKSIDYPID